MRNHHFHIQYFNFYDLDGMGRHLEKMAARGWMLEKMTTFGWHYRRMEPKRLRFTVTYHDTFSVFDPEQSEGQQEYQDLCRQSGWEVAAANGPLQAFYTEDEDAPPIETDPRLFLDTVERLAKKTLFPDILLLVLSVLEACMLTGSLLHSPIRLLSSTASLITAICWLSILVDTSITLFFYWQWHRKAIIAAAAGKFLPVRNHRRFRVALTLAAVGVFYVLIASRPSGYGVLFLGILAGMLPVFLLPAMVHGILKRKGVPAGGNKKWTRITSLGACLLVVVLQCILVFSIVNNPAFYVEPEDLDAPLTVADLTGGDEEQTVHQVYLERSALLDHYTYTVEAPSGGDASPPKLSYEIVDLHVPFFYTLCQNELHSHEAAFPTFYLPAPPVADTTKVYALYMPSESLCRFLFCWENRIVELCANWILTNEQLETAARLLAP